MFHQYSSLHPDGHSATQQQIDECIALMKDFPGPRSYNIGYWQPHLVEGVDLIPEIYHWLENVCNCQLDYSSMPYAKRQIWTLIIPEHHIIERDERFIASEDIFLREDIEKAIRDKEYLKSTGALYNQFIRGTLPHIYMGIHAMIKHMNDTYGYSVINLNKPFLSPYEFNVKFGKYFNNVPVLPVNMTSFYSKPRVVRANPQERRMITNGAITTFEPVSLSYDPETGLKTFNPCYWWDHERGEIGRELTIAERHEVIHDNMPDPEQFRNVELSFNYEEELYDLPENWKSTIDQT